MKNPREKIIILTLFLILCFVLFATVIFSESNLSLSARSAVLYEPTKFGFVYSKNADMRLPMASTTKIMTALVAIENSSCDSIVEIDDRAIGVEGSSLYLKSGESMTMKDLLYGLMLRSANDAASAIAYNISGCIEDFAILMNKKAESIGLSDTHFMNPHGLDSPEHYTTAKDLAVIAGEALKNDIFKEIVSTKKVTITNSDGESRLVVNHNKLLTLYEDSIGVKTGFTKKSGRCLVGAAERDGLTFITVTINAPDDWNDHIKLFDYGYSILKSHKLATPDSFKFKIPVINSDKQTIGVTNIDSFTIISKQTENEPKYEIILPKYVNAPIFRGDILGKVVFTVNGEYVGEIPLVSTEDASSAKEKGFFSIFK